MGRTSGSPGAVPAGGRHSMWPRLAPASHDRYQRAVPPSSYDRRLLLVTGSLVVAAALLVGVLLFFATGGAQGTPSRKPVYIGLETDLRHTLDQGPPPYFAHPFAGPGFCVHAHAGQLLAPVAPGPG